MNKEEFYYVNEQRMEYMELIMMKHTGIANKDFRGRFYDKLHQWRDVALQKYETVQPDGPLPPSSPEEPTWTLQPLN